MGKKKYYAVVRGRESGIYLKWYGPEGAERQVIGFKGARFKGFGTRKEAEDFLSGKNAGAFSKRSAGRRPRLKPEKTPSPPKKAVNNEIVIYTDGGCLNNPGPGGWGAVLVEGDESRELSGGFRMTTNNRMELTACIEALKSVLPGAPVILYTDSKYVANGIEKGWAKRWRKNGWMRTRTDRALNSDLWARLLDQCEKRRVEFRWVKGHAGIPENERCDRLAGSAALGNHLPPDPGFEG